MAIDEEINNLKLKVSTNQNELYKSRMTYEKFL